MKVKYTMDRSASSYNKGHVVSDVSSRLGSSVTISGDVIEVDTYRERDVEDILKRNNVKYTRG